MYYGNMRFLVVGLVLMFGAMAAAIGVLAYRNHITEGLLQEMYAAQVGTQLSSPAPGQGGEPDPAAPQNPDGGPAAPQNPGGGPAYAENPAGETTPPDTEGQKPPLMEDDIFLLPYQEAYPELYCDEPVAFADPDPKTIYLTIDDGPSVLTARFLDQLAAHDVKVTFFLIGSNVKGNEALLRRMAEEGHTIGVHSYSHAFGRIYASVDAFLDDFAEAYRIIEEASGVPPTIFRFPGGSVNHFNLTTYQEIISEMLRRGFLYYDWNVSAADATNSTTERAVANAILTTYSNFSHSIILAHERNVTLAALDRVIQEIQAAGYTFAPLDRSVKPVVFAYPKYQR